MGKIRDLPTATVSVITADALAARGLSAVTELLIRPVICATT